MNTTYNNVRRATVPLVDRNNRLSTEGEEMRAMIERAKATGLVRAADAAKVPFRIVAKRTVLGY